MKPAPFLSLSLFTASLCSGADGEFQPLFPKDGVPEGWGIRDWADVGNPATGQPNRSVKDGTLTGDGDCGVLVSDGERIRGL